MICNICELSRFRAVATQVDEPLNVRSVEGPTLNAEGPTKPDEKFNLLSFMMKKRIAFIFAPALLLVVAGFSILGAPDNTRMESDPTWDAALVQSALAVLESGHYSPQTIDDELSQKAFDLYLERIDYLKRFLLKSDVEKLRQFRNSIDDEVLTGQFGLLDMTTSILLERREQVKDFVSEILSEPFDFTVDERIETDPEKVEYSADLPALRERWRRLLKYSALTRYVSRLETQESLANGTADKADDDDDADDGEDEGDDEVEIKTPAEIEIDSREKVAENMERFFHNIDIEDHDDYMALYLNSIMSVYGPHTQYFPPADKDNFDIAMTGKLEGIGAQLQDDNGFIKVTNIVPGSASWRQGELEAEDVILKVAQADGPAVDVVDVKIDEAVKLIRGAKGTEVRLTVKKPTGEVKIIPIIRDVVELEETYAKSALIRDDNADKSFGYIYLPKFYTDFRNDGSRTSSGDVRKELVKLQRDGVEGIILDLRDNGGGALQDAVDMSGLFFDNGPVVQVKGRGRRARVLSDEDPSTVYDGPLIVLVNSYSASASEILSGALQDYGRAIIVGTSQTFGKGTVQTFADLNRYAQRGAGEADRKEFGSLKLTIQQFYRVNGHSTQFEGVTPDILLPNPSGFIDEVGERSLDHALPWRSINPVEFQHSAQTWAIDNLREKSRSRVEASEAFDALQERVAVMRERREQTAESLNADIMRAENAQFKEFNERFKDMDRVDPNLQIESLSDDKRDMLSDETKKEAAEKWHKKLSKDIYLQEAIAILKDIVLS